MPETRPGRQSLLWGGCPGLRDVPQNDLASGMYRAQVTSSGSSATSGLQATVGDEVEFDFDSNPADIAAGATAIAASVIQGHPPQVTGTLLDASNAVVVQATATCTES
jgi:hypothetical protein